MQSMPGEVHLPWFSTREQSAFRSHSPFCPKKRSATRQEERYTANHRASYQPYLPRQQVLRVFAMYPVLYNERRGPVIAPSWQVKLMSGMIRQSLEDYFVHGLNWVFNLNIRVTSCVNASQEYECAIAVLSWGCCRATSAVTKRVCNATEKCCEHLSRFRLSSILFLHLLYWVNDEQER